MLALLDEPPPKGYSQWNGPLLAEALPGISKDQVWRYAAQALLLPSNCGKQSMTLSPCITREPLRSSGINAVVFPSAPKLKYSDFGRR